MSDTTLRTYTADGHPLAALPDGYEYVRDGGLIVPRRTKSVGSLLEHEPAAEGYIRDRAREFAAEADRCDAGILMLQDRAHELRRYARWYMEAADTLSRNVHESTIPMPDDDTEIQVQDLVNRSTIPLETADETE